jgi:hypothetical protein
VEIEFFAVFWTWSFTAEWHGTLLVLVLALIVAFILSLF